MKMVCFTRRPFLGHKKRSWNDAQPNERLVLLLLLESMKRSRIMPKVKGRDVAAARINQAQRNDCLPLLLPSNERSLRSREIFSLVLTARSNGAR